MQAHLLEWKTCLIYVPFVATAFFEVITEEVGVSWNRAKEGYEVGIQIGNENTKKFSIEGGIEIWNIA